MTIFWITLFVIAVLVVSFLLYLSLLERLYPEQLHATEVTTITTGDIWKLRLCRYRKPGSSGEPILFVHGIGTNQHSFTTPPGASFVDYLSGHGYDCWTIDLRGSRSSIPPFERHRNDATIDGQLLYDIPGAIDHIRRTTGYARVHWIGHSMGGLLLYGYAQDFGEEYLGTGVTMGTPVSLEGINLRVPGFPAFMAKKLPGLCGALMRAFTPIVVTFRYVPNVYPTNVQNVHPEVKARHFYHLIEAPLPRVVEAMEFWARSRVIRMDHDELDVLQGLRHLHLPLLAFYGVRDRLTSIEQARALFEVLEAPHKQFHVLSQAEGCEHDYDHCDLAFARHGARDIYERTLHWLQQHPMQERLPATQPPRELAVPGQSQPAVKRKASPPVPTGARMPAVVEDRSLAELGAREVAPQAIKEELAAAEHAMHVLDGQKASTRKRTKRSTRKPPAGKSSATKKSKGETKRAVKKKDARKGVSTPKTGRQSKTSSAKAAPKQKPPGQSTPPAGVPPSTRRALSNAAAELRRLEDDDKPKP